MKNRKYIKIRPDALSSRKKNVFTLITGVLCFWICFFVMETVARLTRPKVDLYELNGRIPGPNPMTARLAAFLADVNRSTAAGNG